MIENDRIDRRFLENANQAAAKADRETAWSTASYLVKIEGGRPTRLICGLTRLDWEPNLNLSCHVEEHSWQ